MNREELIDKYSRFKHDRMRLRDETKNTYERKYLNGSIYLCDMILADLQGIEEAE